MRFYTRTHQYYCGIDLQGAFIETNNCPLAEGAEVELVIRLHREGKHVHCRFPAKVVRTKPDGAALHRARSTRATGASRARLYQ